MTALMVARARCLNAVLIVMAALLGLACSDGTAPLAVDTTPPVVDLNLSSTNVSTSGNISLAATASDRGGVTKVEFYELMVGADAHPAKIGEDTSEPYELERPVLSAADNGSHEFTAKAYDAAGNVGTSNVATATVNLETTPPAFTISATHDRITTPGQITFSVVPGSGVSRMEIYERGVKVGESAGSNIPLRATIDVSSTDNGSRIYVSKGYGAGGEIGFSNPFSVQIDIRWDMFRELDEMSTDHQIYLTSGPDGAAYLASTNRSESNGNINLDGVLSKYDAGGNRLWTQTYGGSDWESVHGVGVDPSGRPYLSGYILHGEQEDCFLALYDPAGHLLWTRLISTPALEAVCDAATDATGAFYLAGGITEGSSNGGRTDVLVAKLSSDGNQLWLREFGSEPGFFGDDIPTSIAVDPLGGVYVAGYTSGSMDGTANQGGRDLFVTKLDGDGNRLWSRQFGTDYHDFANSLASDTQGGVYVAGGRDHPEFRFGPRGDALLIRYSSEGTLLWSRQLDGGDFDDAWGVAASQNEVHLVGRTSQGTSGQLTERTQGSSDAFLAKLSRDGDLLSTSLLGGPGRDGATGVARGRAGDTYIVLGSQGGLPGITSPGRVLARQRELTSAMIKCHGCTANIRTAPGSSSTP